MWKGIPGYHNGSSFSGREQGKRQGWSILNLFQDHTTKTLLAQNSDSTLLKEYWTNYF